MQVQQSRTLQLTAMETSRGIAEPSIQPSISSLNSKWNSIVQCYADIASPQSAIAKLLPISLSAECKVEVSVRIALD